MGYINTTSLSEPDDAFPVERALRIDMNDFLSLIGDARGSVGSLGVFFTCTNCDFPDGGTKGIVLDGTATGLLRKVPNFEEDEVIIPAMKPEGAEKRFFLRSNCGGDKTREDLRFVLREAVCQGECDGYFEVPVTAKGKRRKKTV